MWTRKHWLKGKNKTLAWLTLVRTILLYVFFSRVENLVCYGSKEIGDTCLKQFNNTIVMSNIVCACVCEREI